MSSTTLVSWPELLAATSLFLVPACSPPPTSPDGGVSPSTTTGTTAPGTTSATDTGTTSTGEPGSTLVGTWVSPSCGARSYPRHIEFVADGTFRSDDLVSPCPPNVACVWSGIIHRKGTYTVAAAKITLTVDGDPGPQGKPLPDTLGLDPATGAPFEAPDGAPVCPYSRLEKKP